jgi:hypothetical protein
MTWFMSQIREQPVYCQGLIQAFIALMVAFGLDLTGDQVGTITAATAALLAFVTHSHVTPLANPKDNSGKKLILEPAQQ